MYRTLWYYSKAPSPKEGEWGWANGSHGWWHEQTPVSRQCESPRVSVIGWCVCIIGWRLLHYHESCGHFDCPASHHNLPTWWHGITQVQWQQVYWGLRSSLMTFSVSWRWKLTQLSWNICSTHDFNVCKLSVSKSSLNRCFPTTWLLTFEKFIKWFFGTRVLFHNTDRCLQCWSVTSKCPWQTGTVFTCVIIFLLNNHNFNLLCTV